MQYPAVITGVGGYLPEDILTNTDLESMVDTNDEWIRTRTGIEERRILKTPGWATYRPYHMCHCYSRSYFSRYSQHYR